MAELEWETNPKRPSLRRAVRHRLRDLEPPIRIAAENFLALESRMDLLGIGPEGELVSVRIGIGHTDAALLAHCLSDLVWLRSHGEDLARLVPDLGIEGAGDPRALLLCPAFDRTTRSAAESLPPGRIELMTYRCYRQRGRLGVLLEDDTRPGPAAVEEELAERDVPAGLGVEHPPAVPNDDRPIRAPAASSGFRTGLSDAELRADAQDLVSID